MPFEPSILTSTMDEDQINDVLDVHREWYQGSAYLDNVNVLGVPNTRYNFGGGREFSTRGGYDVKFQGPDGNYYSRANDGALEKIDDEFLVIERTDFVGSFDHLLGNGYVVDILFLPDSKDIELQYVDTDTMEWVTNLPGGSGTPFSHRIPGSSNLDFVYRPEDNSMYYCATKTTRDSGLVQTLGKIKFDGSPSNTPQVEWQKDLTDSRNYLGERIEQIFWYDGDLYTYGPGIILQVDPVDGRITGRDNFGGQLPTEVDFAELDIDAPAQVTPDGNLHIHIKHAPGELGGGEFDSDTSSTYNLEVTDQDRYIVYDIDNGEITKDLYTYDGIEGVPLAGPVNREDIDGDGFLERTDIRGRFSENGIDREPWASVPDNISSIDVTPYGYILSIDSDILPRIEFRDHEDDRLKWRVYSGIFQYETGAEPEGEAFNHRQIGADAEKFVDEAYPEYEKIPDVWSNPPEFVDGTAQTPTAVATQAGIIPDYILNAGESNPRGTLEEVTAPGDVYKVVDSEFALRGSHDLKYDYVLLQLGSNLYEKYNIVKSVTTNVGGSEYFVGEENEQITFRKSSNVAVANEGVVVEESSVKSSATATATTSSFGDVRVVATSNLVKPQVGILGGGESIDGGPAADETNTLYTNTSSTLNSISVTTKSSETVGASVENSVTQSVTVTTTGNNETVYLATEANPSLVTTTTSIKTTTTEANAVPNIKLNLIEVDTISEPDDFYLRRALTVGETTGADTTPD